jgi:hypothetical protein
VCKVPTQRAHAAASSRAGTPFPIVVGGLSFAHDRLRRANLASWADRNRRPRDLLGRPDINAVAASPGPYASWVDAALGVLPLQPPLGEREKGGTRGLERSSKREVCGGKPRAEVWQGRSVALTSRGGSAYATDAGKDYDLGVRRHSCAA